MKYWILPAETKYDQNWIYIQPCTLSKRNNTKEPCSNLQILTILLFENEALRLISYWNLPNTKTVIVF